MNRCAALRNAAAEPFVARVVAVVMLISALLAAFLQAGCGSSGSPPSGQSLSSSSMPSAPRVAPTSVVFDNTYVGTSSSAKALTIYAESGSPFNDLKFELNGDFARTDDTCAGRSSGAGNCQIAIAFTPRAGGDRTGILIVSSSDGKWSRSVQLSGTGSVLVSKKPFTTVPDDFAGPFPSWINVMNPPYNCKGDGIADDTACLQAGLDSLRAYSHPVLWIPHGAYRITSTLVVPEGIGQSIVGEDPTNTKIAWDGADGGTMLSATSAKWLRVSRIEWDGRATSTNQGAKTGHYLGSDGVTGGFGYQNSETDEIFTNLGYGLRIGWAGETSIDRVKFENISSAGVSTENFNALDVWVRDSVFDDCEIGVTNAGENGAGDFAVYSSIFRNSGRADIAVGNTGYFGLRGNVSIGSHAFFVASPMGRNFAPITAQDNIIIDSASSPFVIGNIGPLMLVDNTILTLQGSKYPVVSFTDWVPSDVLTLGNTFTANSDQVMSGNVGRKEQIDDTYANRSEFAFDASLEALRTDSVINPPFLQPVCPTDPASELLTCAYEASGPNWEAELQSKLDNNLLADGSVVHIPTGAISISKQLVVPGGKNIQIVGDGPYASTILQANPPAGSSMESMILLKSPARAKLREFSLDGVSKGIEGIKLEVNDRPGSRVFMSNAIPSGANDSGLRSEGIDQAMSELRSSTIFGMNDGILVQGGTSGKLGKPTFGGVRSFGGMDYALVGCTYTVNNGGKLVVKDSWHESPPVGSVCYVDLTDKGSATFESGQLNTPGGDAFSVDSFDGDVSLIGFRVAQASAPVDGVNSVRVHIQDPQYSNLRFLAFGIGGFTNEFFLSPSDTTAGANNIGLAVSDYWPDPSAQSGWWPIVNVGRDDDEFIRAMFAQSRRTKPLPPLNVRSGLTDARIERMYIDRTTTAIHLVPDDSSALATSAYTITDPGGTNRLPAPGWTLVRVDDGSFLLAATGTNNAPVGALGADLRLHAAVDSSDPNQRWIVDPVGNGYFAFRSLGTGGFLSVQNGTLALFGSVDKSSQWILEPIYGD